MLLRKLWSYLVRVARAIRALVSGIFSFFARLIEVFFEGPVGAFERLVRKILDLLGALLDLLRTAWLRVFQRPPATPKDPRPTPGRAVLPLLAGCGTTVIWYLLPTADLLNWPTWKVALALPVTWIVCLLLFRWVMRWQPPRGASTWLVESSERTALISFERLSFLGLLAAAWLARGQPMASLVPVMLGFGFLVLLAADYHERPLTDDLPPLEPLIPTPEGGPDASDTVDEGDVARSFSWSVPLVVGAQPMDLTVMVNEERCEQMRSLNPKVPGGGVYADFTPWVIDGSTVEVDRASKGIRDRTEDLAFSRLQEAMAILGFAQSVQYATDEETTGEAEYWRYPIETIFDQVGDCEDSSILAAAVLVRLGHRVLPLVTKEHAAIAIEAPAGMPGTFFVHEGRHYYYAETTGSGWEIGEVPPDVKVKDIRVCPLRLPAATAAT